MNERKFQDKTLSRRVYKLGKIIGSVVKEIAGDEIFSHVENYRRLSIQHSLQAVYKAIQQANHTTQAKILITNAFNLYMNVVNVVEQARRVEKITDKFTDNFDYMASNIEMLIRQGKQDELTNLNQIKQRFTGTAHPTEMNSPELNKLLFKLAENLDKDEAIVQQLIKEAWRIINLPKQKPTPLDELDWGLWLIENQIWPMVPTICRSFDDLLTRFNLPGLALTDSPIAMGGWFAVDRDGNPYVTSDVSWQAVCIAQTRAIEKHITALSEVYQLANTQNKQSVQALTLQLQETLLYTANMRDGGNARASIITKNELVKRGSALYQQLKASNDDASEPMLNCLKLMATFGLTLCQFDSRNDSAIHQNVATVVLKERGVKNINHWGEQDWIDFLIQDNHRLPDKLGLGDELDSELSVFHTLGKIQKYFPDSLYRYVIAMCQKPSDVMITKWLLESSSGLPAVRIVPLIEKQEELENAPAMIEQLMNIESYRRHIHIHHNDEQFVMFSHSDSRKFAGPLKASVLLYDLQQKLVDIAKRYQIKQLSFHGMGGSYGRGNMKTTEGKFLMRPPGAVNWYDDQTMQGEALRYLTFPGLFKHNVVKHLNGILLASTRTVTMKSEDWQLINEMADIANKEYQRLVMNTPDFLKLYDLVTIVRFIKRLPVASRPASRPKGGSTVNSLRAIPWVKAWQQSRLILTSFLGTHKALHDVIEKYGIGRLQQLYHQCSFWRHYIDTLEMALSTGRTKVFTLLVNELATSPGESAIAMELVGSYQQTVDSTTQILNQNELHEDGWLAQSIGLRNPYIDVIHAMQAHTLLLLKENESDELLNLLYFTVQGIANGIYRSG